MTLLFAIEMFLLFFYLITSRSFSRSVDQAYKRALLSALGKRDENKVTGPITDEITVRKEIIKEIETKLRTFDKVNNAFVSKKLHLLTFIFALVLFFSSSIMPLIKIKTILGLSVIAIIHGGHIILIFLLLIGAIIMVIHKKKYNVIS